MSKHLEQDEKLVKKQKMIAGDFKRAYIYDNANSKIDWNKKS